MSRIAPAPEYLNYEMPSRLPEHFADVPVAAEFVPPFPPAANVPETTKDKKVEEGESSNSSVSVYQVYPKRYLVAFVVCTANLVNAALWTKVIVLIGMNGWMDGSIHGFLIYSLDQ